MYRRILAISIVLLMLAPAVAQAGPGASRPSNSSKAAPAAAASPSKIIDISEGEDIEGGVPAGEGEQITGQGTRVFSNLIRIRESFHGAILASAEALP